MNINKLKYKIVNTLDITIIIVAVAIVLAAVFAMNNKQIYMLFDRASDSTVTVSVYDEKLSSADFNIGDKIYFSDSNKTVGTIVSVRNIKEKKYSAINNTLMFDYSNKNIGVQIDFDAKIKVDNDKKYLTSSVFATAGSKLKLRTEEIAAFECIVEDIIIH